MYNKKKKSTSSFNDGRKEQAKSAFFKEKHKKTETEVLCSHSHNKQKQKEIKARAFQLEKKKKKSNNNNKRKWEGVKRVKKRTSFYGYRITQDNAHQSVATVYSKERR